MPRPRVVKSPRGVLTEEESKVVAAFGDAIGKHKAAFKGLALDEKIQYLADSINTLQNRDNPLMTAVPLKPFLWMMLQSGLVSTKGVIKGLLRTKGLQLDEAEQPTKLPEKISVGAKQKRVIDTAAMCERLEKGELDILDYDKLFRWVSAEAKKDMRALSQSLYQELLVPNRALRSISLAPQERVVLGVNRSLFLGWYDDQSKQTPYMYLLLNVGALASVATYWPILMDNSWLKARNARKFVADSGGKVQVAEYIIPMCLASMDVFAHDAENQVRAAIVRFISGASKFEEQPR